MIAVCGRKAERMQRRESAAVMVSRAKDLSLNQKLAAGAGS